VNARTVSHRLNAEPLSGWLDAEEKMTSIGGYAFNFAVPHVEGV
jgi:hypothetical protein